MSEEAASSSAPDAATPGPAVELGRKMKALKQRARAARGADNKDVAAAFRRGSRRLARRIRRLGAAAPVPKA